MTEMTRRLLLAGAAAAPFAGWVRLADAATPKDTVVFAKQIDDIITLDPGESLRDLRRRKSAPTSTTGSCATRPRT